MVRLATISTLALAILGAEAAPTVNMCGGMPNKSSGNDAGVQVGNQSNGDAPPPPADTQSGSAQSNGGQQGGEQGGNQAGGDSAQPKAIYFMTNDPKGNGVVALKVGANGKLSEGSITPTGGKGQSEVDGKTGKPNAPDGLASQGALRVVGDKVFTVNAGSNTLTMMQIDPQDPTKLTMVGQPADTCGDFPVTLAVSPKNNMVCVGNTGTQAGISCGQFSEQGIGKMDDLRPYNLNQTNPPQGPTNTVADTFFNDDETMLLTTVKGDPTKNNTGFLSAFAVDGQTGQLSTQDNQSSPNGTAVLFGTKQIPGTNNLLATDASFGGAILSLDQQGSATLAKQAKIANQKATCWVAISDKTGTAFLTDVGRNQLIEMDMTTGEANVMKLGGENPGMIDIEAKGNFMYALAPGNATANIPAAVAVFDLSGGKGQAKKIQNFKPKGVTDSAQGMAVLA